MGGAGPVSGRGPSVKAEPRWDVEGRGPGLGGTGRGGAVFPLGEV